MEKKEERKEEKMKKCIVWDVGAEWKKYKRQYIHCCKLDVRIRLLACQ